MSDFPGRVHAVACRLFCSVLFHLRRVGKRSFAACALLAVLAVAGQNAAPAQGNLQVLRNHVRREVTAGSARLAGAIPADKRLSFSIVLPLRNEAELNQLLSRLYDSSNPDYR